MTVDMRHLRCFLAVVDEGNITRAAGTLHLSQPALSRTLAQLETHLGARLLDRSTHHLELTDAGQAFVSPARAAVRTFDAAVSKVMSGVPSLRFGLSWSTAAHSAAIVRAWNTCHPDRPLAVRRSDDRLAGLLHGDVDVALVRGPITEPGMCSSLIEDEPRLAALPVTHRLAGQRTLRPRDLAREALVVNAVAGTTTLGLWPRAPRPTIGAEVTTMDDWLVAIAAGIGIGITPASTAALHPHPDIVYVPIVDAPPIPLVLARRASPYASLRRHRAPRRPAPGGARRNDRPRGCAVMPPTREPSLSAFMDVGGDQQIEVEVTCHLDHYVTLRVRDDGRWKHPTAKHRRARGTHVMQTLSSRFTRRPWFPGRSFANMSSWCAS
jgi:DNA-binding transcriptional LysR family regulator